jgi:hypothetical protein
MTVQLEVMIADLSGHQEVRENLLLAVMLVPAVTLLVQVQIQDHLVESGLLKDLLVTSELLEENGLIQDQLVMSVHLVESGLLRDQLVMTVHQDVSGLLKDHSAMTVHHVVMTERLAESGHQNALSVMIVLLVVSGLLRDLLVMTVLQEENGQTQDRLVMTEDQEILVDQIVWKEMTTVREVLMARERSLLTRRLSSKMLFLRSFSQLIRLMQLSQLSGKRWVFTHVF